MEIRSTFNSTQSFRQHSHPQLSLGAIIGGTTHIHRAGKETICEEGDLVLIEPDGVHSCNPVNNQTRSYHMLYLNVDWCLQRLSALFAQNVEQFTCDNLVIRDPKLFQHYIGLIELSKSNELTAIGPQLDSLIINLLSSYCSPIAGHREIDSIPAQIKRELINSIELPPSLEDLSKRFSLRPETILRSFKKAYGLTPKRFVLNARIEKAKIFMKNGESIANIALALGFSDQAQFHKVFVDYTASTPGQYLKANG